MSRYKLKLSQDVQNAGGYHNIIFLGHPEPEDMVNNICVVADGSNEFIPLNANILRDALLSSPEFCKHILGLEIKDATIVNNKGAKHK